MVFPFDYTARGLPLMDGTATIPGYATSYNAMANALDTALDAQDTAWQDADTVETVALLPVTGNWIGRRIFVQEDESLRVCTALPATWMIAYRSPLVGTIAWDTNWDAEPGNSIERTADHVVLTFNAEKTTAVVTTERIGVLPAGYRPASIVYCAASYHGTGFPGPAIVAIEPTGEVFIFFEGTTTQKKVAFAVTFPI